MKNKHIFLFIGILLFTFILIFNNSLNPVYADNATNTTSNETVEEEVIETVSEDIITLDLTSTRFPEDGSLAGTITLALNEKIPINEELTITVGTTQYTKTIKEILDELNYTYEEEAGELNTSNSATFKDVTFSEAGEQYLAVQLPRYGVIDSVEMSVTGSQNGATYPSNVTMDFGDDGNRDWYYFGTFQQYNSDYFKSADYDESTEEKLYINTDQSYFCEMFEIPETKEVRFYADYTKLTTWGNITGVILSAIGENPVDYGYEGGNDNCDLPETSGSCDISLSHPIEGTYLFCLLSTESNGSENIYEIPVDSTSETTTAFNCPKVEEGFCTSYYNDNFNIKVQTAYYDKFLSGATTFKDWETFTGAVEEGVRYYVGSGDYSGICNEEICVVPIRITSDTAGVVKLTSLAIDYEYYNQEGTKQTNSFYDVIVSDNLISTIDSKSLVTYGKEIEIDLEVFNITLSSTGTLDLKASFLGDEESTSIEVLTTEEYYSPSELIDETTTKYSSFLTSSSEEYQVISMLDLDSDMDSAKEKIETYDLQVGIVSDSELLESIEETITDLPWEITFSNEFTDTLIVGYDEIPSEIGGDEVYFQQEAVKVTGTSQKVKITYYNGESEYYKLIKKSVYMNEDLNNLEIYEITPNSISSQMSSTTLSSVSTYTGKDEVGEVSQGETKTYYYLGNEDEILDDYTTIIKYEEEEEEPECTTDDDCEKGYTCISQNCIEKELNITLIWVIIIILIVLGAIGGMAYYFLVTKKQKTPIMPSEKKPTEEPETETTKFIKDNIKKGMKEELIRDVLSKKGWSKADIDKEFAKVKGVKPGSEISNFIKDARKKGISESGIRKVLEKKGWSRTDIDKELGGK